MGEEDAGHRRQGGAQHEGLELEAGGVDPHGAGGVLGAVDGAQGPADPRLHQVEQQQHGGGQQPDRHVVVEDPPRGAAAHAGAAGEREGRHPGDAIGRPEPAGPERHAVDDGADAERGHGQVVPLELQHRDADRPGQRHGQRHRQQGRGGRVDREQLAAVEVGAGHQQAEPRAGGHQRVGPLRREIEGGEHRRGVAADREEGGVAERDLAGVAHQQRDADHRQRRGGRHGELGEQEALAGRGQAELQRHGAGHEEPDLGGAVESHGAAHGR